MRHEARDGVEQGGLAGAVQAHHRDELPLVDVDRGGAQSLRLAVEHVDTLDGQRFLAINGVQTLSQGAVAVLDECERLLAAGISAFRLSPQACDMVAVARIFRDRLDGRIAAEEARAKLGEVGLSVPVTGPMMTGTWPTAMHPGSAGAARA